MNDLRIHVERAIRPIRASQLTKLKMREELYAHLTAIYDEERARGVDEPAAIERAKDRIGTPAELTAELDATVSRAQRWASVLEYFDHRCPGESDAHFVRRFSGYLAAWIVLTSFIPLLASCISRLGGSAKGPLFDDWLEHLRHIFPVFVWMYLNGTVLAYLAIKLSNERHRARIALGYTAGGLCVWATSGLLLWAMSGEWSAAVEAIMPGPWLLLAIFAAPSLAVVAWLQAREKARLAPWADLDLGE